MTFNRRLWINLYDNFPHISPISSFQLMHLTHTSEDAGQLTSIGRSAVSLAWLCSAWMLPSAFGGCETAATGSLLSQFNERNFPNPTHSRRNANNFRIDRNKSSWTWQQSHWKLVTHCPNEIAVWNQFHTWTEICTYFSFLAWSSATILCASSCFLSKFNLEHSDSQLRLTECERSEHLYPPNHCSERWKKKWPHNNHFLSPRCSLPFVVSWIVCNHSYLLTILSMIFQCEPEQYV